VNHQHPKGFWRWLRGGLAALVAGLTVQAGAAQAQTPLRLPDPSSSSSAQTAEQSAEDEAKDEARKKLVAQVAADMKAAATNQPIHDPNVKKAQCCGGLLGPMLSGHGGGGGSCANGKCVPGRQNCSWCNYDTVWGRLIGGIYDCICCPDQCYEPRWLLEANAAFYQDGARPVTQTRIRWDAQLNYHFPDTGEFLWARIGAKGPKNPERSVDVHDLSIYQEVASGNFSFFVETPFRQVGPQDNPNSQNFGDMNLGTKTLLVDCELFQLAFQFRTYILTGNFTKGVGNGHVSLEPSLLTTVKLASATYLQTQVAEWIPLGGDGHHAGAAIHYHFSLNHLLWRAHNDAAAIVGTLECNGLTFQDGLFTRPDGTLDNAGGHTILNFGPGVRMSLCNKLDFGVGMGIGVSEHGPDQLYRMEFRYRF
jgi:hypothetical protein